MSEVSLPAAYAVCREIARREAKNFYWAFRVLPKHKSDAMCAIYAFMRKADDLADDETLSVEERRVAMAAWTAAWRATRGGESSDPVFVAVKDVQRRFAIPDELLEQLVRGTTLDLEEAPAGVAHEVVQDAQGNARTVQVYETYGALRDYCYLVASVVGLVCIRIFGYTDVRAEALAVDTGIAFQLTNILRDVKEDADRGRVYLSRDVLEEHGVSAARLLELSSGAPVTPKDVAMLENFEGRAQRLYRSADELIPLLDADSRPAMGVLAAIYRRLAEHVAKDPAAVFRERVSVPTLEKLGILVGGMAGVVKVRLRG